MVNRFWDKVSKGEATECWNWNGAISKLGYGHFKIDNKTVRAHRVSYELANGQFDTKLFVLHKCDNPRCVNPNHLYLGTQKQNMDDMSNRGRRSKNVGQIGEKHHNAKLKASDVVIIRDYLQNKVKHKEIAKIFGVSRQLIGHIKTGANWN